MIEFTNLQANLENSAGMRQAELDTIVAVQHQYIDGYCGGDALGHYGTCILDARPCGESAGLILRYDLPNGAYSRNFFRTCSRNSAEMAEDSIDELLRRAEPESRFHPQYRRNRAFETGTYQDGELLVLVVNATGGHFLLAPNISINGVYPNYDECYGLMFATAEALAQLSPEDRLLQVSTMELLQRAFNTEYSDIAITATAAVRGYFGHDSKIPAIHVWREWRNKVGYNKKARVFFE